MTESKRRERGTIDTLPSGSLRVRVYAGQDPVTKRPYYRTTVIPPGPNAEKLAKKARAKLVNEVDEGRSTRTAATVGELVEMHLNAANLAPKTMRGYWSCYRNHVRPLIGQTKLSAVDAHVLDSFYTELRRCQEHCNGRPFIVHRTGDPHECDGHCKPHVCKSLGPSAIRGAHFLLSGAFRRAIRWGWIHENPTRKADPPAAPSPDPQPPSPDETARIINACWDDSVWGTLVWLAVTTGVRRGELSALRWRHVDLNTRTLTVRRSVDQHGAQTKEKDTKSHQQRRISLDAETVDVLRVHQNTCQLAAAEIERKLLPDAFVFSLSIDGATILKPDTITQRYGRLVKRLGINTTFHKLRHFSATELISAGVDPRTVGGRLGHGSGGVTTLRVYSAWVSESDQRAAESVATRMPARPVVVGPIERAKVNPSAPYEKIAAEVRAKIINGDLEPGHLAPSQKEVMAEFGVSAGTANRAFELLSAWCLLEVRTGKRALILDPPIEPKVTDLDLVATSGEQGKLTDVVLLHLGVKVREFLVEVDVADTEQLTRLLKSAARRSGGRDADLSEYEIEVRKGGSDELLTRFAVL